MHIKTKRVYDPKAIDDGKRILVDRLWPRGLTKENAQIDLWLKDIAPSTKLRKWYGHSKEKHDDFTELYVKELTEDPLMQNSAKLLLSVAAESNLTLLYAARDTTYNHAIVLKEWLLKSTKKTI